MPNVYTAEFLAKFEVCDYRWGDDKYPNARQLRDRKTRELRGEGWTVKVGKYDYSDLGRFALYWLEATRPKPGKERQYCIVSSNGLYWNNLYGWGDMAGAQFFSEAETKRLNLPVDGVWKLVK